MGQDACGDILVGATLTDQEVTLLETMLVAQSDDDSPLSELLEDERVNRWMEFSDEVYFLGTRVLHMDWDNGLQDMTQKELDALNEPIGHIKAEWLNRLALRIARHKEPGGDADVVQVLERVYELMAAKEWKRVKYAYMW